METETVKEQGNEYMKNKQYKEAIDKVRLDLILIFRCVTYITIFSIQWQSRWTPQNQRTLTTARKRTYLCNNSTVSNSYTCSQLCSFLIRQSTEALHDASSCLELEPTNTKAIFRKGVALFNLKSYTSALNTFQNGTSLPLAAAQKTGKFHDLIIGPGLTIVIYFRVQKLY